MYQFCWPSADALRGIKRVMRFVMWHLQCMVHSLGSLHRRTWLTFLVLTALRGPMFNLSMGVKACGVADVAECPMEADATGRFTLSALCFEPEDFAPDNNYCFRDDIAVPLAKARE